VAGIGFLGRPRSSAAEEAVEVAATMRLAVALLAGVCVVLGVLPMLVLPAIERAARTALPGVGSVPLARGVGLQLVGLRGVLDPALLTLGIVVAVAAVAALRRGLARRKSPRIAEAWGCGRQLQTARMQYTALSFAEPVQRVFDDVLRPIQDLDVSHVAESRYFVESVTFHNAVDDAVERGLYTPMIRGVRRWGQVARRLQPGSVHRYLAYGLGALVVVLGALAVIR